MLFQTKWSYVMIKRSSHTEVFLEKGILKICSKFTGEHPCRSLISINFLCNFIKIRLRHECSSANLLIFSEHLFPRAPLDGCFWINFFLEWVAKSKHRLRGKNDYFSAKESLGILTMLVSILLHKIYQMQATHQN